MRENMSSKSGSGIRLLLDYKPRQMGLPGNGIKIGTRIHREDELPLANSQALPNAGRIFAPGRSDLSPHRREALMVKHEQKFWHIDKNVSLADMNSI
jgi:hypothetical protein